MVFLMALSLAHTYTNTAAHTGTEKLREIAFTMLIIRVINEKIIQASPHKLAQNMSTKPI